jgi:hypothetical protein
MVRTHEVNKMIALCPNLTNMEMNVWFNPHAVHTSSVPLYAPIADTLFAPAQTFHFSFPQTQYTREVRRPQNPSVR